MHSVNIAIASSLGGREEQQDAAHSWSSEQSCLVVLADGVGGNIGGAAAAQAVIETAENRWHDYDGQFPDPEKQLLSIAELAHQKISSLKTDERRSPASTIVALYLDTQYAYWIHCGDSRLYQLRNGEVVSRTRDHSVVQLLLEQGKISEDELNRHPDKGRILKTLGGGSYKGSDYQSCAYQEGDQFLLCSDGYWESIVHGEPILPTKPHGMSTESHLEHLVQAAVQQNGEDSDNTTLALVETTPNKAHQQQPTVTNPPHARSVIKSTLLIIFYTFILIDIIILIYIFWSQ